MDDTFSLLLINHKNSQSLFDIKKNKFIESGNNDFTAYLNSLPPNKTQEILSTTDYSIHIIQDERSAKILNSSLTDKLSEVTHEINNSLAIALSSIKVINKLLAKEELKKADFIETNLNDVKNSMLRIKNYLIEQRTEASSLSTNRNEMRVIDLVNDIKDAFNLVFSEVGIKLKFEIEEKLQSTTLSIVGSTLYQCLFNLINNAFYELKKSSNSNKEILLKVTSLDNTSILLSVIDNGEGISQNIVENIFEKNFTTKGEQGNGLGLHLVKQYIELNNGSIALDKSYNKGAKFDIILPIDASQTQTILCIDDDPKILDLLKELIAYKYSVIITSDIKSALHIIKSQKIDIIISDFDMPKVTGMELYKLIQKEKRNIPFILFSGQIDKTKEKDINTLKDFTYISKTSVKELITTIDDIINKGLTLS